MNKDRITSRSVNLTGFPKRIEFGPRGDHLQDRPTTDRECGNCLHNIRGTEYVPPCSLCREYSLWAENPEPSRIEQLRADLAKAKQENERLRDALGKINTAKVANTKPNSVALYQMFVKETSEQALKEKP